MPLLSSSFVIIWLRKRELVDLLCFLAVLWLLVFCVSSSWCGECVIVAFPGHTHLFLYNTQIKVLFLLKVAKKAKIRN